MYSLFKLALSYADKRAHCSARVGEFNTHVEADEASFLLTAQKQSMLSKGRRKLPIRIYRPVELWLLIG